MTNRITDTYGPDDGVTLDDIGAGTIMIETAVGETGPATGADVPALGLFEGATHAGADSNGSVTIKGLTKVKIGVGAVFANGDYRFTHDASGHAVPMAAGKFQVGRLRGVRMAPVPGQLHECIVDPLRVAQA